LQIADCRRSRIEDRRSKIDPPSSHPRSSILDLQFSVLEADVTHMELVRLLGLGVVMLVAVGAVLLLLRLSERRGAPWARHGAAALGYPPDLFPAQALTRGGPLATLAATQARLVALEAQLPPRSDQRIWLRTFLIELREIMDTAYHVAAIAAVYGRTAQLDRLAAEVQEIEAEVADHVTRRLLARDADAHDELLDGRLATLRLCLRELASLADAHSPIAS
jgi:hypothetical protein